MVAKLPKKQETEAFQRLWGQLINWFNQYKLYITNKDQSYIIEWIYAIEKAYTEGLFDVDAAERKNCAWNKHSFVRYSWEDAIIGFTSEVIAVGYINQHVSVDAVCTMVPSDATKQISGIDLVMQYTYYDVNIQVKTGHFDFEFDLEDRERVQIYNEWLKLPPTSRGKRRVFNRICVVEPTQGKIFICDHPKFIKSVIHDEENNKSYVYLNSTGDGRRQIGTLLGGANE
jgi:hypothetical protein